MNVMGIVLVMACFGLAAVLGLSLTAIEARAIRQHAHVDTTASSVRTSLFTHSFIGVPGIALAGLGIFAICRITLGS